MVYILRRVSVYVSVDVTVDIDLTDASAVGAAHSADCFLASDSFATVFGYLAAFSKVNCRETAPAMERRFFGGQAAQLFQFSRDASVISFGRNIQGLNERS